MLKFCVKVFNSSYFTDHTMDLVYILYDDTYKSKALFSNTLTYAHGLKVKVTDLEHLCQIFAERLLTLHIQFRAI